MAYAQRAHGPGLPCGLAHSCRQGWSWRAMQHKGPCLVPSKSRFWDERSIYSGPLCAAQTQWEPLSLHRQTGTITPHPTSFWAGTVSPGLYAHSTFQQVRIGVLLQLRKPRGGATPPGRVTNCRGLPQTEGFPGTQHFYWENWESPASRTHTSQGTVSESKVWQSGSRLYFPLSVCAK